MAKVTPEFVVTFETEIKGLVTGNWERVSRNLMWDRLMKTRPASGKVEILTWLLETAKIYPEGNGGNKRFDDMVAATHSIEIEDFGAGLNLTKNEIEDNQLRDNPSVGALDYAAKWARDIGAAAAYHPQDLLFKLIKAGLVQKSYDGVSFFNAAHPINANGGGATYSNIIPNVPLIIAPAGAQNEQDVRLIARRNLGKVIAHVRKQRFLNGVARYLRPTVLLVGTDLVDEANFLVGAGIIAQNSNTVEKLEVLCDPSLDDEPGVYYCGVEDMLSDELGAFVFSEREPFSLKTYGPMTEAVLNRMKEFEWHLDGRNTAAFGHPYLFYRCTPT